MAYSPYRKNRFYHEAFFKLSEKLGRKNMNEGYFTATGSLMWVCIAHDLYQNANIGELFGKSH